MCVCMCEMLKWIGKYLHEQNKLYNYKKPPKKQINNKKIKNASNE